MAKHLAASDPAILDPVLILQEGVRASMPTECQCIPERKARDDAAPYLFVHRIPIDCWTQDKQDLLDRRVWVVSWRSDDYRHGRNDGPVAIFRDSTQAAQYALAEAQALAAELGAVVWPGGDDGFRVGDSVIETRMMYIEKPPATEESVTRSD